MKSALRRSTNATSTETAKAPTRTLDRTDGLSVWGIDNESNQPATKSFGGSLADALAKMTGAAPSAIPAEEDPFAPKPNKWAVQRAEKEAAAAAAAATATTSSLSLATTTAPAKPKGLQISVRRATVPSDSAIAQQSLTRIFGGNGTPLSPSNATTTTTGTATQQQAPVTPITTKPAEPVEEETAPSALPPMESLLHPKLARSACQKLHMTKLTRVQSLAWGPILERDGDVLVRSETGSGKTFAYLGPLLHRLLTDCDTTPIDRAQGTLIIVLAPTRELVEQVANVASLLLQNAQFVTVGSIHGGDNRHKEKARLRKGIHLLVATPGRLVDHLRSTESFVHNKLQTVVLDEADRLLDMGFEKAIREIMELIKPQKRILVSATITDGIERLTHFALQEPITRVGETEDTFQVPASLRQHVSMVPAKHRLAVLVSFLRSQLDAGSRKIVVFVSTSDSCEFHYLLLSRLGFPFSGRKRRYVVNRTDAVQRPRKGHKKMTERANSHLEDGDEAEDVVTFSDEENDDDVAAKDESQLDDKDLFFSNVSIYKLHGNMTQVDRAAVFHSFRTSTDKGLLLCTDVASRGLDMPHIDWIVHFDPPTDERCYIHRVGRTARLGKVGDSILFLMPHEQGYAKYLATFMKMPIEEKKHETMLFYLTKLDPSSHHSWMQSTATLERRLAQTVREDKEGLSKISLFAYQSYLRAYSGYPKAVRNFFHQDELHLGHIAHSFGVDEKPSEVRRKLKMVVREDRTVSRDVSRFKQGLKMQVDSKEQYRSTVVNKTIQKSRDWHEEKKATTPAVAKPLQFTEFDA